MQVEYAKIAILDQYLDLASMTGEIVNSFNLGLIYSTRPER